MATITTRASKGAPLSWDEADANFTNLNNDKIEAASPSTLTNKTVNLTSNTLTGTKAQFDTACSDDDFAYVGQANTFTQDQTISSGNLSLSGTGQRITGDFSNATIANRVMFQTSTVSSGTLVGLCPTAYGVSTGVQFYNTPIPGSGINSIFDLRVVGTVDCRLQAMYEGSGTPLPMTFHTGGSERMRIDANGNVNVTSPAGLGYGTGAGGTVTQATSKTTTVTLNKPTGQITMNSEALAANTGVIFKVNNSLVSAADNIIVTMQAGMVSGGGAYNAWASGVGAGVFFINLKNISTVSLSESLVINFAIIKGATA